MVQRTEPWPDGTPCWIDVLVPDLRMAMDFYGALLGWDFVDTGDESGHYLMCSVGGKQVAGIGAIPQGHDMPAAWTTYLAASDLDKAVAAIAEAGGRVVVPPMGIGQAGRMAVATDPTGASFGLWQAGETIGFQVANVPRTPCWNECMTRDAATAKAFYAEVFGYDYDDHSGDGFTYATLKVGGGVVGGLGELPADVPAEVPPHWSAYLGVSDTDATVVKVTELGGRVLSGPVDTPFGRQSQVADNQGAVFYVISVPGA